MDNNKLDIEDKILESLKNQIELNLLIKNERKYNQIKYKTKNPFSHHLFPIQGLYCFGGKKETG